MNINELAVRVEERIGRKDHEGALDASDLFIRDLFGKEDNNSESDFARAIYMLGEIFHRQKKYPAALSEFWIAARIQYWMGDLGALVDTFQKIFEAYLVMGKLTKTDGYLRDLRVFDEKIILAIARAKGVNDSKREGDLRHIQACAIKERGDVEKAISLHTLNFTIRHQANDRDGQGYTLFELAKCYGQVGEKGASRDNFQAALEIFQKQKNEEMVKTIDSLLLKEAGEFRVR